MSNDVYHAVDDPQCRLRAAREATVSVGVAMIMVDEIRCSCDAVEDEIGDSHDGDGDAHFQKHDNDRMMI